MLVKNNGRQLLRTPVKTGLFATFIALVTTFVCFGVDMQLSARQNLAQAKSSFVTVGVIEYSMVSDGVESDLIIPDTMFDFTPLADSPYVQQIDQRQFFAGFAPEVKVSPEAIRDGNRVSILLIEALSPQKGRVIEVLFDSRNQYSVGQEIILTDVPPETFTRGQNYAVTLSDGSIESFETGPAYPNDRQKRKLIAKGKELEMSLHIFGVYGTDDIASVLAFNLGKARINKGRYFSPEDYHQGNKVCILNEAVAAANDFALGDKISLSLRITNGSWTCYGHDAGNPMELDAEPVAEANYEIIGTYSVFSDMGPNYGLPEQILFIPRQSVPTTASIVPSMNFMSFRLENGSAEDFMSNIKDSLPEMAVLQLEPAIRIYDQGYGNISQALTSMQGTALLLTLAGSGAALLLVVLLSNLYVGRQLRTVAIMRSLGVSRQKCLAHLLLGVLILTGVAALLGGCLGYTFSGTLTNSLYTKDLARAKLHLSYSDTYGDQAIADYKLTAAKPCLAPTFSVLAMIGVALLASWISAAKVLGAEPMQIMTANNI